MKVADLQKHLSDLASFLENAKAAKAITDDLRAISTGLAPFANLPLKDFAAFLGRAEQFDRTGQLLASGKAPKAPKALPKAAPDVDSLARETLLLYERAADPSTTQEAIDALLGRLVPLKKAGLVTIAERIGLKGMKSKKLDKILSEIRSSIEDRKGSYQRSGMLHPKGETADQFTTTKAGV